MKSVWNNNIGIQICVLALIACISLLSDSKTFSLLYGLLLLILWKNKASFQSPYLQTVSTATVLLGIIISAVLLVTKSLGMLDAETYLSFSVPFLLATIPAMLLLRQSEASSNHPEPEKLKAVGTLIVFIGILLLALSIRTINLDELSIWWDELYTAESVKNILEYGIPKSPLDQLGYWRGVAYSYFVSIFAYFGGWNEFSLRIPGVLFSVGILSYLFVTAKKTSLLLAVSIGIFLALSPYSVETARFARFYIMNTFLFLVAIQFALLGFYQQRTIFKGAFLLMGVIMVHTVQLGAFFIFIICAYFADILLNQSSPFAKKIKFLTKESPYLVLSSVIALSGNIVQKLLDTKPVYLYPEAPAISNPRNWDFIDWPDLEILQFFQTNYIPLVLFFLGISFAVKSRNDQIRFIALTTVISIFCFTILNRNTNGARIFYLWEPLYVFFSFYGLHALLARQTASRLLPGILTFAAAIFLLITIQPNAYSIVTRTYGSDVTNDPFRSTAVSAFRSDEKTPYQFLNQKIRPDDIWISVKYKSQPYVDRLPDYILDQNLRWNTFATRIDETGYFRNINNVRLINTAEDLENIINQNPDHNIWISVRGSSLDILHTTHLETDFREFLSQHDKNTVYRSQDLRSRILLFRTKKLPN